MESPSELEPGREHKIASYKGHRRGQRIAKQALRSTTLEEALEGGTEALQDAKDQHEGAAAILRGDLSPNSLKP